MVQRTPLQQKISTEDVPFCICNANMTSLVHNPAVHKGIKLALKIISRETPITLTWVTWMCRGRVLQLEAECAKLNSSCRKLQAAEASWAEAEARAAAHAGAEQALRYQLTHLQNAVKVHQPCCCCCTYSSMLHFQGLVLHTSSAATLDNKHCMKPNLAFPVNPVQQS